MEENVDQLRAQLNEQVLKNNKFQSITNEIRKQEWLSVRILLKIMLGEEKEINYLENGKPFLTDQSYQISISHTKNYVAVITHPSLNLGIDIETRGDRILKLKHKFMSDTELFGIKNKDESLYCLLHWSAKETLFKIIPENDFNFIEHLQLKPFEIEEKGCINALEKRTQLKQEFTIQYQVFEDFVLTWTTK